jgi:hypothetical protein
MPAMYRAVTLLVAATLSGQWINEPARGVPRTRDGKPNVTGPAPRTGPADYAPDDAKLSPEAQKEWDVNRPLSDSLGPRCLPSSFPMADVFPIPKRIVQTPNLIVALYEGDIPRQIHMDGRRVPAK